MSGSNFNFPQSWDATAINSRLECMPASFWSWWAPILESGPCPFKRIYPHVMIALYELKPLKIAPFSLGQEIEFRPWFLSRPVRPLVNLQTELHLFVCFWRTQTVTYHFGTYLYEVLRNVWDQAKHYGVYKWSVYVLILKEHHKETENTHTCTPLK